MCILFTFHFQNLIRKSIYVSSNGLLAFAFPRHSSNSILLYIEYTLFYYFFFLGGETNNWVVCDDYSMLISFVTARIQAPGS